MLNLRKPPLSLLAGYILFAAFMVLESLARQGAAAKDATAGKEDRGTTRMLGTAYGMGVLLVPIAAGLRASRALPQVLGPLVMLAAVGLRMWAAMTLGRFYTRTLRTARDRIVVRDGPYRFVRHPGYLGTLLMWTGFRLSTRDWLIGAVCGVGMWLLYRHRINAEENMLLEQLGDAYVSTCGRHRACCPCSSEIVACSGWSSSTSRVCTQRVMPLALLAAAL